MKGVSLDDSIFEALAGAETEDSEEEIIIPIHFEEDEEDDYEYEEGIKAIHTVKSITPVKSIQNVNSVHEVHSMREVPDDIARQFIKVFSSLETYLYNQDISGTQFGIPDWC